MRKFLFPCLGLIVAWTMLTAGCKKSENEKGGAQKSQAQAQDIAPMELKVKWPVGNRYTERLQLTESAETTLAQAPKPIVQKVKWEQEYALGVLKEREKGGKEVELEFLSADIEVTSGGKVVMSVDTKGESGGAEGANALGESYRQLVGAKIKYHLNDRNLVEKIEGLKEFGDKAAGTAPAQVKAVIRSTLNEDYFKQLVEFGKALPGKPVKPGDSWPVKTQIAMGPMGFAIADMTYTFRAMEPRDKRTCAAIDFTGTLTSKPATNSPAPAAPSMTIEKGTLSGKTWFDPELGTIVETAIDQDLTTKVTYTIPQRAAPGTRTNTPEAPQGPVQQTASTQRKQKINIKLVDFSSVPQ